MSHCFISRKTHSNEIENVMMTILTHLKHRLQVFAFRVLLEADGMMTLTLVVVFTVDD